MGGARPAGRRDDRRARGADVVLAFHRNAAELAAGIKGLGQAIFPDGAVWIAWPRKAGGHVSDITENGIATLCSRSGSSTRRSRRSTTTGPASRSSGVANSASTADHCRAARLDCFSPTKWIGFLPLSRRKPITTINDPRYLKAVSHPVRVRILAMLDEGPASPKQLADRLGASLGVVAYHVRTLHDLDLLKLVGTRQRRGATEHMYATVARPSFSDEAWAAMEPVAKQRLLGSMLRQIGEYANASAAAGGFDRDDANISRLSLRLDERGWTAARRRHEEVARRGREDRGRRQEAAEEARRRARPHRRRARDAAVRGAAPERGRHAEPEQRRPHAAQARHELVVAAASPDPSWRDRARGHARHGVERRGDEALASRR